jgi:hypothetical protein
MPGLVTSDKRNRGNPMQVTMLAIFDDTNKRDLAVAAAQEVKVDVMWIGTLTPVMQEGNAGAEPRPFCLFRGDIRAGLIFMQNGAMSCGGA